MGIAAASGSARPEVLVLMGVSGCGKSTVAALLAGQLGWPFEEGDALHPKANIEKMAADHPLTDDDRRPWLRQVAAWIDQRLDAGEGGVITCSALKRAYRDVLNRSEARVVFVYLVGDRSSIAARLTLRQGHFMPPNLLDSQFADLEEPTSDEPAIRVDIGATPAEIARRVTERLGLAPERS
jgi:carbohydrate kinase (thermoresistant glucokinase family)